VKEPRLNGFDIVAGIYDRLARLLYGKSIVVSQLHFLNEIPDDSRVLILGGGTGWILEELLVRKPRCKVWYVDASQKMIALAQKRVSPQQEVYFIHGSEKSLPKEILFDVVITNFYLDLFTEASLAEVITSIKDNLHPQALWLVTDFVDGGKWWQRSLLKTMYFFFGTVSAIEARSLAAWDKALVKAGLSEIRSAFFYGGFIRSVIYARRD
jgi:ubiquinone/menaquinone biosynthesis C-methylase UbiE